MLTGDLTSVAPAALTGYDGATYTGAAVIRPRAAGPAITDWSQAYIAILGSGNGPNGTGELVIANGVVPRAAGLPAATPAVSRRADD